MATPHISAEPGQIAPLVLMPGDPRRAEKIAADFLDSPAKVSDVRGIACYTGTYEGTPMSVMASGMGLPSLSIYATELYRFYGVQRIVRVGTCGAYLDSVKVRDVIIASAAHTNSSVVNLLVPGVTVSLAPSPTLLRGAMNAADALQSDQGIHVGPVLASDHFYLYNPETVAKLESIGTLAVEMEAAGLYSVAMLEGKEALVVLTVSDHLKGGGEDLTAEQREDCYRSMVKVAAGALLA
ncbi:MAG TPA: purine-nucleoside phosphorylase [Propionibacteriaceae bacterium]|nr:purine-nucleoside phosphorylase [Propionibacteriaceae bacterium]HPZ49454.1 purine-nucleoside phosphorylase [Propionibacteriaceae bacterium]HQE30915.1 purine-nucleoside phosphorylase [Propionibacteriaceae bacterium]